MPLSNVCDSHIFDGVACSRETVISWWHTAVNDADLDRAATAVSDPVVVLGPQGAGAISRDEFVEWVRRSGITLVPRSWHPVGARLMAVEQDATWPADRSPTRVATVFRVTGDRVSAALRLPDLDAALDLARICDAMATTE